MRSPTTARWQPIVLLCGLAVLISYIDRTNISVAAIRMQEQYHWSETTKGYVLSSFFVGYVAMMAASGALANRLGGRVVLGFAVLWWSAFTMLTPIAASVSFGALILARIALGAGEAAVFPASISMVSRWVPIDQQSRATALFSTGLSLGTMISLPMTGWLVRRYGWPMPFYIFGAVGLVWVAFWFARVPEGRGIEESTTAPRVIPWKALLSSSAIWAIIVANFCSNWSLYVLLAWLPSYFKSTFGVTLANAGLLSAAPWAFYFICGNLAGGIADRMIAAGRSRTFVRKLMQNTATIGMGAFLLLLPLAHSATVAMLLICAAAGILSLCLSGFGANPFDVAPRYADVVWGISNTGGTMPGIIGVAVTGWLLDRTHSYNAPFTLTAIVAFVGALFYWRFASGEQVVD